VGSGVAGTAEVVDLDAGGSFLSASGRSKSLPTSHFPLPTSHFPLPTQHLASRSITPDVRGATPKEILDLARKLNVRSMRLQFTDILGVNKNVEIPASQFAKAMAGDSMFDGSSIEGFGRIEESDMLLAPDLSTFRLFPFDPPDARGARLICDINLPTGDPFPGDPRGVLMRTIA
jgi:glutamine synthetase